ncbi:MAG: hypothetical protein R3250_12335, partial [Melioribacteraceae bacterium]|nr:hypothetical protein [Melioribacteraceae bacterium]
FENKIIAGNTFNYPYIHGNAILMNGYSFVSTSDESISSGKVELDKYEIVDLIIGEEKTTNGVKADLDSLSGPKFKVFPEDFNKLLSQYLFQGGNLFLSGSYIGSDVFLNNQFNEEDLNLFKETYKYKLAANHSVKNGEVISVSEHFLPQNYEFRFITELNDSIYNAEAPDALSPTDGSETLLRYKENFFSAAVGYKGKYRLIAFGFPFETIDSHEVRRKVMGGILKYFAGN